MSMIANLQYGWTLFVNPIADKFHWAKASIQVAFTIFVLAETWLVPIEGYLVDRIGPAPVAVTGGILVGLAWVINSIADSLPMLYLAAAIGGIGAGAVYGTCVGNALVVSGSTRPRGRAHRDGLRCRFGAHGRSDRLHDQDQRLRSDVPLLRIGPGSGGVRARLAAQGARTSSLHKNTRRSRDHRDAVARSQSASNARTPAFWVMYAMFVLMATGGLMATAQLAPIARDFKVADVPVAFWGSRCRRSPSRCRSTACSTASRARCSVGCPITSAAKTRCSSRSRSRRRYPAAQPVRAGSAGFRGAVRARVLRLGRDLQSLSRDLRRHLWPRFASANAGLLYTAKGTAALLVPVTSLLSATSGGWHTVFLAASVMNLIAAFMALLVLKPMRARMGHAAMS